MSFINCCWCWPQGRNHPYAEKTIYINCGKGLIRRVGLTHAAGGGKILFVSPRRMEKERFAEMLCVTLYLCNSAVFILSAFPSLRLNFSSVAFYLFEILFDCHVMCIFSDAIKHNHCYYGNTNKCQDNIEPANPDRHN